jgi:hypothetical protein
MREFKDSNQKMQNTRYGGDDAVDGGSGGPIESLNASRLAKRSLRVVLLCGSGGGGGGGGAK